jgi:hypothetical protein
MVTGEDYTPAVGLDGVRRAAAALRRERHQVLVAALKRVAF